MAINMAEARKIVEENLPGSKIISAIDHEDKFLFIAHRNDALEGKLDPFFSVTKSDGHFRDFSPQDYENPAKLIMKLKIAQE